MSDVTTVVVLQWEDLNIIEDGFRIYRSDEPFTKATLPPVLNTAPRHSKRFLDMTAIEGNTYYYMVGAFTPKGEKFSNITSIIAKSGEIFFRTNNEVGMISKDGVIEWEETISSSALAVSMNKELFVYSAGTTTSRLPDGSKTAFNLIGNTSQMLSFGKNIYAIYGNKLLHNYKEIFDAGTTIRYIAKNAMNNDIFWVATYRNVYTIDRSNDTVKRDTLLPTTIRGISDTARDSLLVFTTNDVYEMKKGFHQDYILENTSYSSSNITHVSAVGDNKWLTVEAGVMNIVEDFTSTKSKAFDGTITDMTLSSENNVLFSTNTGRLKMFNEDLTLLYDYEIKDNVSLQEIETPYIPNNNIKMSDVGFYITALEGSDDKDYKFGAIILDDYLIEYDIGETNRTLELIPINPETIPTLKTTVSVDVDFEVYISPVIQTTHDINYSFEVNDYNLKLGTINPITQVAVVGENVTTGNDKIDVFISPVIQSDYYSDYTVVDNPYTQSIQGIEVRPAPSMSYEVNMNPVIRKGFDINTTYTTTGS